VEIVITAQERRELAELAAGEGRPVATMIREATLEYLAERLERRTSRGQKPGAGSPAIGVD